MINQHQISTRHAVLLGLGYFATPILLVMIGYFIYSNQPPDPVERRVYQLREYAGNGGANSSSDTGNQMVYNMPPLTLSISSGEENGIMKIKLGLEVDKNDIPRLPNYEPRIIERITLFMLQKNSQDMRNPDRTKRMMADLTDEISTGALPLKIDHVFFQQFVLE